MVQIKELILRLPGLDKDQAGALANEVANRIAQSISPEWQGAEIPHLSIQIPASATSDKTAIAAVIASCIIEEIKWNRP